MTYPGLSAEQAAAVDRWFPGATLVADYSWAPVERAVLRLHHGHRDVVVKAGGQHDHHMAREITAHEQVLAPLAARLLAPGLLRADRELGLVATTYLPGSLVEGHPAEWEERTYSQAGRILKELHSQGARLDDGVEARADATARAWLDRPHRIARVDVERIAQELATPLPVPSCLVPTHGDWQPRNWVVDNGRVAAIDFGRFAWRAAETDLARLDAQQWRGHPELQTAFFDGYGFDPRRSDTWRRTRLREAIGTAVWAHQVEDRAFEDQGLRMIAEVLAG